MPYVRRPVIGPLLFVDEILNQYKWTMQDSVKGILPWYNIVFLIYYAILL